MHHDYSLKHFAEEALETFAHVDGRFLSSFRSLLTRPGELAANFLAGRRRSQIGPLQIFVICNLIYFLVQPFTAFAPFTSTLRMQTTERSWRQLATRMVATRVQQRKTTFETYATEFDHTAHLQGKSLVIVMVPLFALGSWALYGRRRRFYSEHVVAAFYTFAFVMLWMGFSTLVLSGPVIYAVRHQWSGDVIENAASLLIVLPFAAYLFSTGRRVLSESWPRMLARTAVLTGWTFAVLTIYRCILFFTTFYAT